MGRQQQNEQICVHFKPQTYLSTYNQFCQKEEEDEQKNNGSKMSNKLFMFSKVEK